MKSKGREFKERINYVVGHHEDGRTSYTGQSVNYGCICSSWESVEDLSEKMKGLISIWLDDAKTTMEQESPLEMRELTEEEWDSREDNIDFWEIERMKRILNRPSIRSKFHLIISPIIADGRNKEDYTDNIAGNIINALINQENR